MAEIVYTVVLEYAHEDDNTPDKLSRLSDVFVDMLVDWAEANNFLVGAFPIDERVEENVWTIEDDYLDEDDDYACEGGLMTDEDYEEIGTKWTPVIAD